MRNGEQEQQRHVDGDTDSDAEPSDDTLDRRTMREKREDAARAEQRSTHSDVILDKGRMRDG